MWYILSPDSCPSEKKKFLFLISCTFCYALKNKNSVFKLYLIAYNIDFNASFVCLNRYFCAAGLHVLHIEHVSMSGTGGLERAVARRFVESCFISSLSKDLIIYSQ